MPLEELTENANFKLRSNAGSLSVAIAMSGWTIASLGAPAFTYRPVMTCVCQEVNRLSMSFDAIPTAARSGFSTQCIGKPAEQLLVIASRSHADLRLAADIGVLISPEDIWPASLSYPDQTQYWFVPQPDGQRASSKPLAQQAAITSPSPGALLKVSDSALAMLDILPVLKNGDFFYKRAMSGPGGVRRLIRLRFTASRPR